MEHLGLKVHKRYAISPKTQLVLTSGSVVDFRGDAIVNAANKGCIGGGGVDRAVKLAGGDALNKARWELPVVQGRSTRCPTGEARITISGDLHAKWCIHAVGPDYPVLMGTRGKRALPECDALLVSAYRCSLECASQKSLQTVAFSLLSAGVFRGMQSLENILNAALDGIVQGLYPELEEVYLVAFTKEELKTLLRVAEVWFSS